MSAFLNALRVGLILFGIPIIANALTFEEWQSANFTYEQIWEEGLAEPTVDPDGDGTVNLHEYVFSGNPLGAESGLAPKLELVDTALALTYRERQGMTDVSIRLQGSDTLMNWITFNTVTEADRVGFIGYDEVTLLDPVAFDNGRRFLRLRVELLSVAEPRAPLHLALGVTTPTSWGVTWTDPNTTETGYAVERLLPTNVWERLVTLGADTGGWQHTSANYQTSMRYRVVAIGTGGLEAASAPVTPPDSDGDGIPDALELGENYVGASDTYASAKDEFSSTGSGVSDGWLAANGFDPVTHDTSLDTDEDGLTDAEEAARGTNPHSLDTDEDGVLDAQDGWPRHNWIKLAPLPETHYCVIPLRPLGWPASASATNLDDYSNIIGYQSNGGIKYLKQGAGLETLSSGTSYSSLTPIWSEYRSVLLGQIPLSMNYFGINPNPMTFGWPTNYGLSKNGTLSYWRWTGQKMQAITRTLDGVVTEIPQATDLRPFNNGAWAQSSIALAVNQHGDTLLVEDGVWENMTSSNPLYLETQHITKSYILKSDASRVALPGRRYDTVGYTPNYSNTSDWADFFQPTHINESGQVAGYKAAYGSTTTTAALWNGGEVHLLNATWLSIVGLTSSVPGAPATALYWRLSPDGAMWAHLDDQNQWDAMPFMVWNPETQAAENPGVKTMNERFEIIGGASIFRNGVRRNLSELVSTDWSSLYAQDINNRGVILAEATRTIDAQGLPIPTAQQQYEPVLLMPIEVVFAQGAKQGKPLPSIPLWEPNDGIGKGEPIFSDPTPSVRISSIGTTLQLKFLGTDYTLTKNSSNSLLYENGALGMTALLSANPLNDPNAQEFIMVTISQISSGLNNSEYDCAETTASSNTFESSIGATASVNTLSETTPDSITITLYGDTYKSDFELVETGNNTNIFTKDALTVKLVSNIGQTLLLEISLTARNLSNTRIQLSADASGLYRNFESPIATDSPLESVPDVAGFYIQVPSGIAAVGETPHVELTTEVDGEQVSLGEVAMSEISSGIWRSVKKLVLTKALADGDIMTTDDKVAYQLVRWPAGVPIEWSDTNGSKIKIQYAGGSATIPAQPNGIALQSLDWRTEFGQGLDTENRIRKPLEAMGVAMYKDYNATRTQTLSDYIKGKQIWYSMSHGATVDGTANTEFGGLNFTDKPSIKTSDLTPLNLNYRLVIVDGCCSAQTSTSFEEDAENSRTLLDGPRNFAQAFGPNVAYIGWGWEMLPNGAQVWTSEFVGNLKGRKTVQQAFDKFHMDNDASKPAAKLMKLYGRKNTVIDLNKP